MATTGTEMLGMGHGIGPMILGKHGPGDIDLTAANMTMHIDGSGHHHHTMQIIFDIHLSAGGGIDDTPILNIEIMDPPIDTVSWVVDRPSGKFDQHFGSFIPDEG